MRGCFHVVVSKPNSVPPAGGEQPYIWDRYRYRPLAALPDLRRDTALHRSKDFAVAPSVFAEAYNQGSSRCRQLADRDGCILSLQPSLFAPLGLPRRALPPDALRFGIPTFIGTLPFFRTCVRTVFGLSSPTFVGAVVYTTNSII